MKLQKLIGERVKELRMQQRMTQEILAEKSNLDISYISRIENGEKNITITTLDQIADALNVKTSEIITSSSELKDFSKDKLMLLIKNSLIDLTSSELNLIYDLISHLRGTK